MKTHEHLVKVFRTYADNPTNKYQDSGGQDKKNDKLTSSQEDWQVPNIIPTLS